MASTGTVAQVIGSTFDAQFPESDLPDIYNAVEIQLDVKGETSRLVGEVAKHLGGGMVRCVALGSTDGMRRGQDCVDSGSPVKVPVGEEVLGSHETLRKFGVGTSDTIMEFSIISFGMT